MKEEKKNDKRITAKVKLVRYRFPKDTAPVSGKFAIVVLKVEEIIEGEMKPEYYIDKDRIVTTGIVPIIKENMDYVFTGEYEIDKKWGAQFKCINIQLSYSMSTPEDQKKFLSFFMTPGQIEKLYESHENPMELLENNNLTELTKIKGVGPVTAQRLCSRYSENKNNSRAYVELKELGLTKKAIDKIVLQLGSVDIAVDTIMSNPYSLIKLVRGYGWEKADKIALAQGFGHGCKERCIAYTLYRLQKIANENGNSRVDIDELIDDVYKMCSPAQRKEITSWIKSGMISESEFEEKYQEGLKTGKMPQLPQFFYSKESRSVGLTQIRLLEKKVANRLKVLNEAKINCIFESNTTKNIIEEVEKEQGYEYTHEQKKAMSNILASNVNILTGSSGTGKSSTLKPLIKIFDFYGLRVAQCALSGRASSLLTEYTGLEGKTIHRLLGWLPEMECFKYSSTNLLPYDVIILDETSMVGEELFLSLIESIKPGAKLIMLGDTKQLPPISVGNILADCISSGYINVNRLTIIQRQAARSGIISQSVRICNGESIVKKDFSGEEVRGELQDFKLICNSDSALVHRKAVEEFKRLHYSCGVPVDDIQIVVPTRSRGINSCRSFNEEIQNIVNRDTKKAVTEDIYDNGIRYSVTYRPGDRIIIIKNNYQARKADGGQTAIFNGNMGHIIDINEHSMIVEINKENIIIPRDDWGSISHSYAISCHKCQGSQALYVIVVLDKGAYTLLTREWLYTAVTRARKYCVLAGQPAAISTATRYSDIKIKKTWLKDDLSKLYREKIDAEGGSIPLN